MIRVITVCALLIIACIAVLYEAPITAIVLAGIAMVLVLADRR